MEVEDGTVDWRDIMRECYLVWASGEVWEWDPAYSPRRVAALIRSHARKWGDCPILRLDNGIGVKIAVA